MHSVCRGIILIQIHIKKILDKMYCKDLRLLYLKVKMFELNEMLFCPDGALLKLPS